MYGAEVQQPNGVMRASGFLIHFLNFSFLCPSILSEECLTKLGPVGCVLFTISSPPAGRTDAKDAETAQGGSTSSGRRQLTIILSSILGGLAGLAMLAAVLLFALRAPKQGQQPRPWTRLRLRLGKMRGAAGQRAEEGTFFTFSSAAHRPPGTHPAYRLSEAQTDAISEGPEPAGRDETEASDVTIRPNHMLRPVGLAKAGAEMSSGLAAFSTTDFALTTMADTNTAAVVVPNVLAAVPAAAADATSAVITCATPPHPDLRFDVRLRTVGVGSAAANHATRRNQASRLADGSQSGSRAGWWAVSAPGSAAAREADVGGVSVGGVASVGGNATDDAGVTNVVALKSRVLGKGASGRVYEGEYQGAAVAVKVLLGFYVAAPAHAAEAAAAGPPSPPPTLPSSSTGPAAAQQAQLQSSTAVTVPDAVLLSPQQTTQALTHPGEPGSESGLLVSLRAPPVFGRAMPSPAVDRHGVGGSAGATSATPQSGSGSVGFPIYSSSGGGGTRSHNRLSLGLGLATAWASRHIGHRSKGVDATLPAVSPAATAITAKSAAAGASLGSGDERMAAAAYLDGGGWRFETLFRQEVDVLGRCQHPNIVRLLAACITPPRLCLVMELMESSLAGVLYGPGRALLPLDKVLHVAAEICNGLAFLHPTIIHRDLKPANVLMNDADSPDPIVKLSDFGLARIRSATLPTERVGAGTPAYLAPECYDSNNNVVTHHVDMYSLGVLIWTMLTGKEPWKELSPVAVGYKVAVLGERLPLEQLSSRRCPAKLRQLVRQCWEGDPYRRPAAAEVTKELLALRKQMLQGGANRRGASSTWSWLWPGSKRTSNGAHDASDTVATCGDDLAVPRRVLSALPYSNHICPEVASCDESGGDGERATGPNRVEGGAVERRQATVAVELLGTDAAAVATAGAAPAGAAPAAPGAAWLGDRSLQGLGDHNGVDFGAAGRGMHAPEDAAAATARRKSAAAAPTGVPRAGWGGLGCLEEGPSQSSSTSGSVSEGALNRMMADVELEMEPDE